MKPISDVTALVHDNGLFLGFAERLARDCKRVLYFKPHQEGFSTINKAVIGDGIENVEWCGDIWKVKNEVDLWCFPDIEHSGLQLELESQGKAVWGSRAADRLELDREYFMSLLAELRLPVPKFTVKEGITALREYLKDKEDCYVKISFYRGSLETFHWRDWELDANALDLWAVRFGSVREFVRFLVFEAIDAPIEIGGDTYDVDGQWPGTMLLGIEEKDKAFFSSVTKQEDMPPQLQRIMEAFSPVLRKHRYRNQWSMETMNDLFIDPTLRPGLPSNGSQQELWENFSEIVWAGANGELVEPVPAGQYSAEVIVEAKASEGVWPTVRIPKELRQWIKLADNCGNGDIRSFPRKANEEQGGWLVAIGDTPAATLETLKGYVDMLPEGLSADIVPIADIIKGIEEEESSGLEFSREPMPEPEKVLS